MKVRVLAVCLVVLATLLATHQAVGAPGQESACVTVTMHAMSSTGIVAPGNTIALGGQFQNCSSQRARFSYSLSAISSCGQRVDLAAARKTLDPGAARIWSISYTMPPDTCSGPWEATMQLTDGSGRALTTNSDGTPVGASTTVTVQ